MIQIFDCDQGSEEWQRCRLGIPTASEFKSILAKGEGKMRRTYMMKLLGERFTGQPADNYTNAHMERGKEMEDEARETYAFERDVALRRVGFVRNGDVGCSPDSLIGEDGTLEIKTRLPHLQMELLVSGKFPAEHLPQVQGQLWVTGRAYCDFVSHWPGLPQFVKRVERDEAYIKTLAAEVGQFVAELDDITAKVERFHGVKRAAA